MGKNQSASNLTNIIKQDASGNITFVSGSTTLMSVSSSGAITTTGNVAGTASYASNADLLDGLDSTVFTLTSSFAAQTASFTAFTSSVNSFTASQLVLNGTYTLTSSFAAQTASFTAFTSSVNSFTASQLVLNGTYATTGSNTFAGIQTVNSNLIVTGSITAQTLVVQTITSSVDFVTGSTRFGSILGNTHVFSGSVTMNPGGLFVSSSGLVGIGTTSPEGKLTIQGTSAQPLTSGTTANSLLQLVGSLNNQLNIGSNTVAGDYGSYIQSSDNNLAVPYPLNLQPNGGNVGIGTSSPLSILDVRTASATMGNYQTIQAFSTDSAAINLGGGISLGGYYTSTTSIAQFASIVGRKENGTSGNYDGYLAFGTNAQATGVVERMRITSAGQVGIGGTPSSWDTANVKVLQLKGTALWTFGSGVASFMSSNIYYDGSVRRYIYADYAVEYAQNAGSHIWYSNPAGTAGDSFTPIERMRITSAGYVGIDTDGVTAKLGIGRIANTESNIFLTRNTTTADVNIGCIRSALGPYWYDATSTSLAEINLQTDTTAYYKGAIMFSTNNSDATANRAALRMYINAAGSIGTTKNGTGIYNASDIRLKKNITPIENSLSKVLQLNPVKFNWVDGFAEDGKDMLGFIAQEVQNIIPETIEAFGGEDNIVEIGDLKVTNPLRINEKFIIPVLVKAIQELNTKLDAANVEIEALKAR